MTLPKNWLEPIACPLCSQNDHTFFSEENGFKAVKCNGCGLVYVNPRPSLSIISEAVQSGTHTEVEGGRNVVGRRVSSNVTYYRDVVAELFDDLRRTEKPVSWLDIGAGFGELIEGVNRLFPTGSDILGIEPMQPKAAAAQKMGLNVKNIYLKDVNATFDVVSLINVFSHIPDINLFINEIKRVLKPGGYFLIETGNIADLQHARQVPTELDLPDHLIFAGEKQLELWLSQAGFEIQTVKRVRIDTLFNFLKNVVKKVMGRSISVCLPFSSGYRSLIVRARLSA